jgi:pimeloyl-ACP methyl ester carboxylesterase
MRVIKTMKSWKFWLTLLLAPMLLVGCSNLFVDVNSDFISDDIISRETVQVGDISLSYLRAGEPDGQRVIFLHGTPGDAGANWVPMLRAVPEGYEFIAIDRPGFGHTKPHKAVTSLDDQAAVLEPLLVVRGGKGTILVGHSLGGPIIAAAAANYPKSVGGIVIAAGALDPDLEDVWFIQRVGTIPPFSWLLDKSLRNSNRELIALEDELRLLQPKLAGITQPVMIVHGTKDELVPYANVAFMQREFTGTQHMKVTKLEGMDHFLQWKKAVEIFDAVKAIVVVLDESHPAR